MAWLAHFNPYHDKDGRFSSSSDMARFSRADFDGNKVYKNKSGSITEAGKKAYSEKADKLDAKNQKLMKSAHRDIVNSKNYLAKSAKYEEKAHGPLAYIVPGKALYDKWRAASNAAKAAKSTYSAGKKLNRVERNNKKIMDLRAKIDSVKVLDADAVTVHAGEDYTYHVLKTGDSEYTHYIRL